METSQSSPLSALSRRLLLTHAFAFSAVLALAEEKPQDPWPADRLIEPADLARALKASDRSPTLISVAFPALYRQRHIPHAIPAGPASKPEGLAALRQAVSALPKDADIVIYCGCCPMKNCPNIRPAFSVLESAGFRNVRILNLRTNFHTDWSGKGYPVEPAA